MKVKIEGCYSESGVQYICTKCDKTTKQIFHIRFSMSTKFFSTWLCLDCFNEVFRYYNCHQQNSKF